MSTSYPNPATGPVLPESYEEAELAAIRAADNGVLAVAQLKLNRISRMNRRTAYAAHGVLPVAAPTSGLPEGRDVLPAAVSPAAMIFPTSEGVSVSAAGANTLGDETLQPDVENTLQQMAGQWANKRPQGATTPAPALDRLDRRRLAK